MSDIDDRLADIEARANAATSAPWDVREWVDHLGSRRVISGGHGCYEVERLDIMRAADAEHIAGMDPDTTLWLLNLARERGAEVERLRTRLVDSQDGFDWTGDAIAQRLRADVAERERDEARAALDRVNRRLSDVSRIIGGLADHIESECDPVDGICHGYDVIDDGRCALAADLDRARAAIRGGV